MSKIYSAIIKTAIVQKYMRAKVYKTKLFEPHKNLNLILSINIFKLNNLK